MGCNAVQFSNCRLLIIGLLLDLLFDVKMEAICSFEILVALYLSLHCITNQRITLSVIIALNSLHPRKFGLLIYRHPKVTNSNIVTDNVVLSSLKH